MKKMKISPYVLVLSGVLFFASCAPSSNNDSKEVAEDANDQKFDDTGLEDDTEFAVTAADGGMLEVQLGELAKTKATSQEVKAFADMMVTDHTKANEELKSLAAKKNITLPTTLSDKSRKSYEDLSKKTGKEFDEAYASLMVDDHQKTVNDFKKQAENGNDPELKSWAAGKVPALEHHLERSKHVKNLADSLKRL
jgi:putative membrane protein